jgi:hypothetical protein
MDGLIHIKLAAPITGKRKSTPRASIQTTLGRILLAVVWLALAALGVSLAVHAENSDVRTVIYCAPVIGALVFAAIGTLYRKCLRAMGAGFLAVVALELLIGLVVFPIWAMRY